MKNRAGADQRHSAARAFLFGRYFNA